LQSSCLSIHGITLGALVTQVGAIKLQTLATELGTDLSGLVASAESNIVRCPDEATAKQMIELIENVRKEGDTVGGVITCIIQNSPVGLGEPLFDKLQGDLAKAMFSINAVHGFEYGSGFDGSSKARFRKQR
jgi:chorismate synthase